MTAAQMPHASTMESMGRCVFCGLPANDPGPCEKRPHPRDAENPDERYPGCDPEDDIGGAEVGWDGSTTEAERSAASRRVQVDIIGDRATERVNAPGAGESCSAAPTSPDRSATTVRCRRGHVGHAQDAGFCWRCGARVWKWNALNWLRYLLTGKATRYA